MLDFGAGVVYEGEAPPVASPEDVEAVRVWNLLQNGMGGMDWSGFALAVEMVGSEDVEALIERLLTIKAHKPPKQNDKD